MQQAPHSDSQCKLPSNGSALLKSFPRHMVGLTLPELMIPLTLLALLLGLGMPGFNRLMQAQRASSAAYSLSTYFASARMTAITQRVPVTVCPSVSRRQCANTSDWSRGWIVYRDPRRRDQPDTPDDILYEASTSAHPSIRLVSSPGRHRVRFQPNGLSSGSNLKIRICTDAILLREVIVNNSGRVRTQRAQDAHGCDG